MLIQALFVNGKGVERDDASAFDIDEAVSFGRSEGGAIGAIDEADGRLGLLAAFTLAMFGNFGVLVGVRNAVAMTVNADEGDAVLPLHGLDDGIEGGAVPGVIGKGERQEAGKDFVGEKLAG